MKSKRALILGIGGQDGYFLSHLLTNEGYSISGLLLEADLRSETVPLLPKDTNLTVGSVCDVELVRSLIRSERPDHIYNFAGISFIPISWDVPGEVIRINGYAVGEILNILRHESPATRFFQAGSSEMFGHEPVDSPQNENTPFRPDNPYGSAKVLATNLTRNYRSKFGLFACVGILYNHESPVRPPQFVTRKITGAAAEIKLKKRQSLKIGDLDGCRDWSYAGDIVQGIWRMMTAPQPRDYLLSSGKLHSVRDILNVAFSHLGLDWKSHVILDPKLKRGIEGKPLLGDPSSARTELGWIPETDFGQTIRMMVEADMERESSKSPCE